MNINDGCVLASLNHIGPGPGPRAVRGLVSRALLAVRFRREPQTPIGMRDVFNVLFEIPLDPDAR